MHDFQFPSLRLIEAGNPKLFAAIAQRWLTQREAENHAMLATLSRYSADQQRGGRAPARWFTLQDGPAVLAAVIVLPELTHITWASLEMIPRIVEGLSAGDCTISAVTGPGHVAYFLANAWAQRAGSQATLQRSDRVYQLSRVIHTPPAGGRLALATADDFPVVLDWFGGLARETASPSPDAVESLARQLIQDQQLFLWHQPGPVAMAAVVDATPSGVSLRHIYVPKGLRRNGHGKAVSAALATRMLAAGKRFCFLVADPADHTADTLLQKVGARTICEYAHWRITPPCTPVPAAAPG
jgi:hypothetical protein